MLTDLQNKGNETVEEFKNLYNFNDEYFKEAENQGKKAMMILGTYVNLEKSFEDYTNLTKLYYGDDYVYYYKGHPNTPTGMWPEKQKQLDELEVIDVDSSIAAELICSLIRKSVYLVMEQVHLIRHQMIWHVAYIIRLKICT